MSTDKDITYKDFPYINPTGKGGFGDNPQNINPGGRKKNSQRVAYWLQFFKDMTMAELKEYVLNRSIEQMYVAELLAYEQISNARSSFKTYKDIIDRTEGRAPQNIKIETEPTGGSVNEDVLLSILEDIRDETKDRSGNTNK